MSLRKIDRVDAQQLIAAAAKLATPFAPNGDCSIATVAAALVTDDGQLFTGVCIDVRCSIGFCAEHSAVAEMVKSRRSHVRMIVAVNADGKVLPPCGRCRELLWQIDRRNADTMVILGSDKGRSLRELLPERV